MLQEIIRELWQNYRGRVLCSIFGLLVGVSFIWLGFFKTIFLILCLSLGFFLGNKLDKKEDLLEWLDRLLPQDYHR